MRYRLVFWDFDGTLADTLITTVGASNRVAARHSLRPVEDVQSVRGLPPLALLRSRGLPLLRLPALVAEVLTALRGRMSEVRLFPGVDELLRVVARSGSPMGVLSSNSRDNILACLRANGVEGLFDSVIGYRRLFGKGRPLRRLLRARGLSGREALYVGDEVRDIEAARRAGADVAAVTWGFQAASLLAEHGPDHLVERPDQLLGLLG